MRLTPSPEDFIPAIPNHPSDASAAVWQQLIASGDVWRLPPSFGRTASALIAAGVCHR